MSGYNTEGINVSCCGMPLGVSVGMTLEMTEMILWGDFEAVSGSDSGVICGVILEVLVELIMKVLGLTLGSVGGDLGQF